MKTFKEFEESYGRRHDAYTRDYHSSISGMGKHQSHAYHADGGANDEGWDREHHHKPADHPHSVHINGKKWKTFGSHSHATNVARKIKGATVHKEEVQIQEETEQLDEISDKTLMSYAQKVHDDSQKHDKDPSKRSAEKRNKSVMGFSRALNKLESRPHKEETEIEEGVVQFTKHKVDTPREITGDDVENAWAMKVHAALDDKISYQHNGITLHHKNGDTTFVLGGHKPIFDRDAKGKLKFKDDLGPARAAFKFPRKSASKNNVVSLKKEEVEQIEQIDELSSELLARYKHNASLAASAADKAKKYDIGHKRFKGIMKATFKQFANDAKK